MKEGGVKKTKKRPNNQNSNKTSSVNQAQSGFQPSKGRESSRFNEGRCCRGAELSFCNAPAKPSHRNSYVHPLGNKKIIRCCAKQGFYLIPASSLFSKPAKGGGSRSGSLGTGMVPAQQGWRRFFQIWFILNNDPSLLKRSCAEMIINIFTFQTLKARSYTQL